MAFLRLPTKTATVTKRDGTGTRRGAVPRPCQALINGAPPTTALRAEAALRRNGAMRVGQQYVILASCSVLFVAGDRGVQDNREAAYARSTSPPPDRCAC